MDWSVRPVADVDPGWRVASVDLADLPAEVPDWLTVTVVVETQLSNERHRFWLHFEEINQPAVVYGGTTLKVVPNAS